MLQLSLTRRQPLTDLPQGMGVSQLAKQHRNELAPTGEAARVPFAFMLFGEAFELRSREQLQKLAKNAAYSIQGGASWLFVVLENCNQPIRGAASIQNLIG